MIADLLGGTAAMRKAGEKYLTRNPKEGQKSYDNRLKKAVLYPAFKQTVLTTSSRPFKQPVRLKSNVPEQIRALMQDVDLEGQNLTCFANQVLECAMAYGVTYVLTDFPYAPEVQTLGDLVGRNLRPYWVHIHPSSVIGITSEKVNGVQVLTEFRYHETVVEQNEQFEEIVYDQIRVLRPGAWQIWRRDAKTNNYALLQEGQTTLDMVPVTAVYTNRTGFYTGEPLFSELAYANIEHWDSRSEQQNILHVARVPILVRINAEDQDTVEIGTNSLIDLPVDSDMKYVEHSGAAINAGRQDLQDLQERMTQAGAELLQRRVTMATATEVKTDANAQMTVLQSIAVDLEDAISRMLQHMADWLGLPDGGQVEVYKDFTPTDDTVMLNALQMMFANGILSKQGLFENMHRMGFVDENTDYETEQGRIESQSPDLAGTVDNVLSLVPNLTRFGQAQ